MTKIQQPRRPWENVQMDWVTGLPPRGDKSYQQCLLSTVEKLSPFFGTNLSFSKEYHPQTDVLAERMIQNLEDMVRGFGAYGLESKYCDGFTHDWCTLLPELELAYKTSIDASTYQTPAILAKGLNPKLCQH
ncbi:hypothetical protein O181_057941 [Austropuccinia psidii MF-1]|uniref:Uncharacterized protein n=1 Tax=Austropuccinia psidii MF-1 TaxID=1389203 RepID=A0A9Q3EG35_9BASI|nr:hypothetical protein [Austropuccinia psidii MF-1]